MFSSARLKTYVCSVCGGEGIRLWRVFPYSDPSSEISLYCKECSKHVKIKDNHTIIPAIPSRTCSFWGPSFFPKNHKDWWDGLPETKESS